MGKQRGRTIEARYHVASHVRFREYEKTNKIIGCYVPTSDYEKEIKRRERRPIETMVGMDILEPYKIIVDAKEDKVSFKRFPPTIEII